MATRKLSPPQFPIPPKEYSQTYMAEVLRAFSLYVQQQNVPGDGRHTNLTLTRLPTHDSELEPGSLFQIAGHVLISVSTSSYPLGLTGIGSVGAVTTNG